MSALSIVDAMNDPNLFQPWFEGGASWDRWRCILKAAFALPMSPEEVAFFQEVAGGRSPPTKRVKELWIIAGRRAGKDSIASMITAYSAALFDHGGRLRPGERALCLCLANDRDQAGIVLDYTKAFFERIPLLRDEVTRATKSGFQLENGVDIAIGTNNFRAVRGRTILCAVLDEVAFWKDENSAAPDEETYKAILPGMATLSEAMLIGISSPYRKSGLLYNTFATHFGKETPDILVVKADSMTLHPTLDPEFVRREYEKDPASAAAEYGAEWRTDIEAFVDRAVIEGAIVPGRYELPRASGVRYLGFLDAAGGSGNDSMALAIAHSEREGDREIAVLDVVRERKPPFSPDAVTAEFAGVLRAYGVAKVTSDRFALDWVVEAFAKHGIALDQTAKSKSVIYGDFLAPLNSGRVELLDNPRLVAQLSNLERRTARSGRESIDARKGMPEDVANASAGALVAALADSGQLAGIEDYLGADGQGEALDFPALLVFATVYVESSTGKSAVVTWADARHFGRGLVLCDFEVGLFSDRMLQDAISRMEEVRVATNAPGFSLLSDAHTVERFNVYGAYSGHPRALLGEVLEATNPKLPAIAGAHVSAGKVRISRDALAKAQSSPLGAALSFEFARPTELSTAIMLGVVAAFEQKGACGPVLAAASVGIY